MLSRLLFACLVAAVAAAVSAPADARSVPLTKRDRQAINATLDAFVRDAVQRRAPARAYELVTPALRADTRRADWTRGDIPVYPYPAAGTRFHEWLLSYSEPGEVGIELILRPRRSANVGPIVFNVDFRRVDGRWLVESFIPAATYAPEGEAPRMLAHADFAPQAGGTDPGRSRVNPNYAIVIPLSILGSVVLVLLGVWLIGWFRGRAAEARYRSGAGGLPPLPHRRS
jgi:hypothetical protein